MAVFTLSWERKEATSRKHDTSLYCLKHNSCHFASFIVEITRSMIEPKASFHIGWQAIPSVRLLRSPMLHLICFMVLNDAFLHALYSGDIVDLFFKFWVVVFCAVVSICFATVK